MTVQEALQSRLPTFCEVSELLWRKIEIPEEQLFILKAVAAAMAAFVLREWFSPLLLFVLCVIVPVFFLPFVLAWSASTGDRILDLVWNRLTLIPTLYSDERVKSEEAPWGTYALILLNIFVFCIEKTAPMSVPLTTINYLVFPPFEPSLFSVPASLFMHMFVHADFSHLWGNMFFLWGVGTVLEKRIGRESFLRLYLATGVLASLVSLVVYEVALGRVPHSVGASGAISGIMGVFAVRCYFTRLVFPVPILGLLPICFKIRMNALVFIGMYFFLDLKSGMDRLNGGVGDNVNHWAHLAGMVAGMILAWFHRMGTQAVTEKRTTVGVQSLQAGIGLAEGEEALRTALASSPSNLEATLALARMGSRSKHELSVEAARLYGEVISKMIEQDPGEATEIFREYFDKYQRPLEPALQLRLATLLYRRGDLDRASRSLHMLADSDATPPDIREKAIYHSARLLDEMGLPEAARVYDRRFLALFPRSPLLPKVFARLGIRLRPTHRQNDQLSGQTVQLNAKLTSSPAPPYDHGR